jgi:hypothetical protein
MVAAPALPLAFEEFEISIKLFVVNVPVQLPPEPGILALPRVALVVDSPVGVFVDGGVQPVSVEQRSIATDFTVVALTVVKLKVYVTPVALGSEFEIATLRVVNWPKASACIDGETIKISARQDIRYTSRFSTSVLFISLTITP